MFARIQPHTWARTFAWNVTMHDLFFPEKRIPPEILQTSLHTNRVTDTPSPTKWASKSMSRVFRPWRMFSGQTAKRNHQELRDNLLSNFKIAVKRPKTIPEIISTPSVRDIVPKKPRNIIMINISDNRYFFTRIRCPIFETKRGWISTPLQSIIVRWMSLFMHRGWKKRSRVRGYFKER